MPWGSVSQPYVFIIIALGRKSNERVTDELITGKGKKVLALTVACGPQSSVLLDSNHQLLDSY